MKPRLLSACVRLDDTDAIPADGLNVPSFKVSLSSDRKLRTAWRGEVRIRGATPWYRGEERMVELQIEAKPFEDYVANWRPTLFVTQNDALIGTLRLNPTGATPATRRLPLER